MRNSVKLLTAGVVFFGLLTAFFSCQKEGANTNSTSTASIPTLQGVKVKNGMLAFDKQSDFASATEEILKNQDNAGQLQQQFTGFVSFKQKYDEVMSLISKDATKVSDIVKQNPNIVMLVIEGSDNNVIPIIDAVTIQYLANDKGLFQIGDTIYKFTRDAVFQYLATDFDKGIFKVVKQDPVSRSSTAISEIGTRGETLSQANVYQRDSRGNEEKRILGEISCFNTGIFSEVSAVTKHQKRGFLGGWTADAKTDLSMRGTVAWLRVGIIGGTNAVCAGGQKSFSTSTFQVTELKQLIDSKTFSCNYILTGPTGVTHSGRAITSGPANGQIFSVTNIR
jgi:hypothetical protein